MSEPLDEPVRAELVEQPQPPLSISHLLLWMLGSAAVLGSYRTLAEPLGEGQSPLLFHVDQLVRSLTMGGGAAALLIYARRLVFCDAPLPRQPGHWLLAVQGLVWPAYWWAMVSVYGWRGAEPPARDWESFRRYVAVTVLFYLWGSVLYATVLIMLREAKRWRTFFVTSALTPLLHALLWCCVVSVPNFRAIERPFILLRISVTLPLLALCVLRDGSARIRRDWMHAAGVGFYVLGSMTSLVVYVLQSLASR